MERQFNIENFRHPFFLSPILLERVLSLCLSPHIPPVFLFEGPLGIGKYSCAVRFAYALWGCHFQESSPANTHRETIKTVLTRPQSEWPFVINNPIGNAIQLSAPPAGIIGIEDIRALHTELLSHAFQQTWRIVIIDGPLTPAAQNALLKGLEEGPQHTLFFLIPQRPILPTVASRSIRISFSSLGGAEKAAYVNHYGLSGLAEKLSLGCPGRGVFYQKKFDTHFVHEDLFHTLSALRHKMRLSNWMKIATAIKKQDLSLSMIEDWLMTLCEKEIHECEDTLQPRQLTAQFQLVAAALQDTQQFNLPLEGAVLTILKHFKPLNN